MPARVLQQTLSLFIRRLGTRDSGAQHTPLITTEHKNLLFFIVFVATWNDVRGVVSFPCVHGLAV
jgi:hypothetical protein